jgi:hypothetical protein
LLNPQVQKPQKDSYQGISKLFCRFLKCEFFYSWIDRPYFSKNTLCDVTEALGLGPYPEMTKEEWSIIRSSLGTPRRFSPAFIDEQKGQLYAFRAIFRDIMRLV